MKTLADFAPASIRCSLTTLAGVDHLDIFFAAASARRPTDVTKTTRSLCRRKLGARAAGSDSDRTCVGAPRAQRVGASRSPRRSWTRAARPLTSVPGGVVPAQARKEPSAPSPEWPDRLPLKNHIPLVGLPHLRQPLDQFLLHGRVFQLVQLGLDLCQTGLGGRQCRVVDQVFHERRERVGRAEALDEAGNGELHEVLARAAQTVAGGAEARHVALLGQLADDRIERAHIAEGELFALHALAAGLLGVAAQLHT